jgi:hypothetical protein
MRDALGAGPWPPAGAQAVREDPRVGVGRAANSVLHYEVLRSVLVVCVIERSQGPCTCWPTSDRSFLEANAFAHTSRFDWGGADLGAKSPGMGTARGKIPCPQHECSSC